MKFLVGVSFQLFGHLKMGLLLDSAYVYLQLHWKAQLWNLRVSPEKKIINFSYHLCKFWSWPLIQFNNEFRLFLENVYFAFLADVSLDDRQTIFCFFVTGVSCYVIFGMIYSFHSVHICFDPVNIYLQLLLIKMRTITKILFTKGQFPCFATIWQEVFVKLCKMWTKKIFKIFGNFVLLTTVEWRTK